MWPLPGAEDGVSCPLGAAKRSWAGNQVCPLLGGRPGRVLTLPITNFSNFPFRGWGRPGLPARRPSFPHKGGRVRPAPPATATLRVFGKEKRTRPRAGRRAAGIGDTSRLPPALAARATVKRNPVGTRGPQRRDRVGATHPTWERAAGSCWRCASTGRRAAATGPRAAPGPWQPPPLGIDRPERARCASTRALRTRAGRRQRCGQMWRRPARAGVAAGEAQGPGRPRGCAGGRPGRRVRARGVVGPGARVTHDFSLALRGKQETPRQQLGRTSRRPGACSPGPAPGPRPPSQLPITSPGLPLRGSGRL